jgi:hypothetical protein
VRQVNLTAASGAALDPPKSAFGRRRLAKPGQTTSYFQNSILNAIAPLWNRNETLLVPIGAGLFAGRICIVGSQVFA